MKTFRDMYGEVASKLDLPYKYVLLGNLLNSRVVATSTVAMSREHIRNIMQLNYEPRDDNIFDTLKRERFPQDLTCMLYLKLGDLVGYPQSQDAVTLRELFSKYHNIPKPVHRSSILDSRVAVDNHNGIRQSELTSLKSIIHQEIIDELDDAALRTYIAARHSIRFPRDYNVYAFPCSKQTLNEVAESLREAGLLHLVIFAHVLPDETEIDDSTDILMRLYLEHIDDVDVRNKLYDTNKHHEFKYYESSVYSAYGITDKSTLTKDNSPTKSSINLYREMDSTVDPLDVFLNIINNKNGVVVLRFNFKRSGDMASNDSRVRILIEKLYSSGSGYLIRNSWINNTDKVLKGGSLLLKVEDTAHTIKLLKLYGCNGNDLSLSYCMRHIMSK